MRYNGRDKYWAQHEVNMPAGGGSVDRAPDSRETIRVRVPIGAINTRHIGNESEGKRIQAAKWKTSSSIDTKQWGHCFRKEGGSVMEWIWERYKVSAMHK